MAELTEKLARDTVVCVVGADKLITWGYPDPGNTNSWELVTGAQRASQAAKVSLVIGHPGRGDAKPQTDTPAKESGDKRREKQKGSRKWPAKKQKADQKQFEKKAWYKAKGERKAKNGEAAG